MLTDQVSEHVALWQGRPALLLCLERHEFVVKGPIKDNTT